MSDNEQAPEQQEEEKQVEEKQEEKQEDACLRTVFVGSISFSSTEENMKEVFEKYGNVTGVRIPKRPDGKIKGFAFVEYETEEEAKKACEMDQKEVLGRTITVNISRPPSEHHDDRRGGYGRRDDRRGGYDRRDDRRGGYGHRDDRRGGYDRRDDRRGGYGRRDDRY